mmetsp:Transcript_123750/g.309331  ORF Transcript_123750/g.309331 Transcript_123750/m.309331 type:complete len:288 (+) Transcript_123750:107-970(+)
MRILVRRLTGRTICVEAEAHDTVARVQAKVRDLEGIPCERQQLLLGRQRLDENKTLAESGVTQDATLHLVLRLPGLETLGLGARPPLTPPLSETSSAPPSRLNSGDSSDWEESLWSEPQLGSDTGVVSKGATDLRVGPGGSRRCPARPRAATDGTVRPPAQPLELAAVHPGHLRHRAHTDPAAATATGGGGSGVRLCVKIVGAKAAKSTLELSVRAGDRIDAVKAKIEASSGIPAGEQRLIFAARQLEGQRTVQEYSLHEFVRPLYLVRDTSKVPAVDLKRGILGGA